MKKLFTLLALGAPLFCLAQKTSLETISVEPYLGFENYEHFTRLNLKSSNASASYIEGFEFEWGFHYKLRVKVIELRETLSDGTQYDFALEKVLSKTAAPDSFTFRLHLAPDRYYYELPPDEQYMNATFKATSDSTYCYFDEVEIVIPEEHRDRFKAFIAGNGGRNSTFKFDGKNRIRLVSF